MFGWNSRCDGTSSKLTQYKNSTTCSKRSLYLYIYKLIYLSILQLKTQTNPHSRLLDCMNISTAGRRYYRSSFLSPNGEMNQGDLPNWKLFNLPKRNCTNHAQLACTWPRAKISFVSSSVSLGSLFLLTMALSDNRPQLSLGLNCYSYAVSVWEITYQGDYGFHG